MPTRNKINAENPLFRSTSKSFFYDDKGLWKPQFPTIYQLEYPKKYRYFKVYDLLYEFYFEQFIERKQEPILDQQEIRLHNYLKSMANRGVILSTRNLAKYVQMDRNVLIRRLDRLEDALLIHRVQRLDLSGKPNDLVVHEIPYFIWLEKDKQFVWDKPILDKIWKRVKTQETRLNRTGKGIYKENGGDKRPFDSSRLFIPRARQKFAFDYKKTFLETFDNEADSFNYAQSILLGFARDKDLILKDAKKYDDDLRDWVKATYKSPNGTASEKHYRAALTLRKIYAPVMSEF